MGFTISVNPLMLDIVSTLFKKNRLYGKTFVILHIKCVNSENALRILYAHKGVTHAKATPLCIIY